MSVCVGVAVTFTYLSLGVGALSMRNHWSSYGHVFDLVVEGISLMISRVYYQQLGVSRKLWYNIYIRKREKQNVKAKKSEKKWKKFLTGSHDYGIITE